MVSLHIRSCTVFFNKHMPESKILPLGFMFVAQFYNLGGRDKGKHRASEGVCPRAAQKKEVLFLEAEAEILSVGRSRKYSALQADVCH